MRVALDYGKTGLEVEIPDANLVGPLGMRPVEPLAEPERALATALASPIGTPPLAELARGQEIGLRRHLRHHAAGAESSCCCGRSCQRWKKRAFRGTRS